MTRVFRLATAYLVGGVVMALAFGARAATADVDADVHPADEVLHVAKMIAATRGLPENWLDNAARTFIPTFKERDWRPVLTVGGVQMLHADERAMLAMKVRASRGQRDQGDITYLCRACGIHEIAQAVEVFHEYFPDDRLPEPAGPFLRVAVSGH
jgi:hypothetical protein